MPGFSLKNCSGGKVGYNGFSKKSVHERVVTISGIF